MNRLSKVLASTCAVLITMSSINAQVVWQRSSDNPVLPEWTGLVDDPSGYKYAFEGSVMYDSTAQLYRMWFTSLSENFGASYVISRAISFDGKEWYAGMKNPAYRVATGRFDNLVRAPRVISDHQGYKMYYSGQNGNSLAIGLATSPDGKTWQRASATPVLHADTAGSWDSQGQAFCDVYYDDTTYYMWFAGGDGVHGAIGLAKSSDDFVDTRPRQSGLHAVDIGVGLGLRFRSERRAGGKDVLHVLRRVGKRRNREVRHRPGNVTGRDSLDESRHRPRYSPSVRAGMGARWAISPCCTATARSRRGTQRFRR